MRLPEIDFDQIRPIGGTGKREGFEQFICELATDDAPSADARFTRLHGAGGDGGVECFWTLPDGTEHGWQAKYWTAIDQVDKAQLDASVQTALNVHPKLTKYTIAIPVDPTGPTGRSGKSLLERIEEEGGWRDGWNAMAAERGMTVEFQLEWRTSLITRLQRADTSGVRTRYWFDADLLPPAWWRARLTEAIAAARPRYIPELTVTVPAANAIAALCGDPGWTEPLDRHAAALEECLSDLRRDAEDALGADMGSVAAACQPLTDALATLRDHPNPATLPQLMEALDSARATVTEQERRETQAMTDKHGNGWDTVGWRQFQAEYQTSFPAAAVDALRKLERQLDELTTFAAGPLLQVAGTAVMLLTGAAGTGKTFVGCDTVRRRLAAGRPSVFLHGRWFVDDDPLIQLRDRLQLPTDLTGEETLGVLDQAGRTAGATVLVMIDALNETVPRRVWRDHLDRIIPLIARFEHLRLVMAVRTHYRTQMIPDQLQLPSFDHQGFEGLEYEAVAEYADYYNLEPPTSPPLQGEFSNPLFLRLLCEALRSGGRLSLDHAGMGLPELTRLLLEAKNRAISDRLGAAEADRIVHRAMSAIALTLGEGDVPWLERSTARQVVAEIWPDQTVEGSLLEALVAEGLLAEDIVDVAGSPTDIILVAFERLGHHLVVAERIKGLATVEELRGALDGGPLRTLLGLDGPIDHGLLEALSVAAAERYGIELVELNDTIGDEIAVLGSVVAGLPWRNPANITPATSDAVKAALAHPETFPEAMEMVFRLATKPDHPLNADWLHDLFAPLSMPDRDALLIPWLYDTYDASGAVDRLVRWARERDLASVGDATCWLWVTALVWCTGCSDRRVRDAATVAAARLLARHPDQAPTLLQRFLPIDDDWVQQRALDIAYTALLRAGTNRNWAAAAAVVAELVFAEPPSANAAIRDAGRSLLEAAHDRNALPNGIDPSRFRPPNTSSWPIDWPDEDTVKPYEDHGRYPKLAFSCTGDDFFTYQISPLLRYRQGVDLAAAGRRVLLDAVELGYDERHAAFDRQILATFGPGRGKPKWIERIGKKYQWIALARLLGVITDHTTAVAHSWDPPPPPVPGPLADRLRQLDPTCCEPRGVGDDERPWVPGYDWSPVAEVAEDAWVHDDDIPDVALTDAVHGGRRSLVLAGSYDWGPPDQDNRGRRRIWVQLTAHLVKVSDLDAWLKSVDGRDLTDDDLARPPMMTTGFVGEYPFGIFYRHELHRIEHESNKTPIPTWPASLDLLGEYGYAPDDLSTISLDAPSPLIFGDEPDRLRWDGAASWRDQAGLVVARTRRIGGPNNELTIDYEWVDEWLRHNELTVVWVEIAGKDVLTGLTGRASPGRLLRTRVRYLKAGVVASLAAVHERIAPRPNG